MTDTLKLLIITKRHLHQRMHIWHSTRIWRPESRKKSPNKPKRRNSRSQQAHSLRKEYWASARQSLQVFCCKILKSQNRCRSISHKQSLRLTKHRILCQRSNSNKILTRKPNHANLRAQSLPQTRACTPSRPKASTIACWPTWDSSRKTHPRSKSNTRNTDSERLRLKHN